MFLLALACIEPSLEPTSGPEPASDPDPTATSGSTSMVASADGSALYVVAPDDGVVARVDVASGAVSTFSLPGEPSRIARVNGRIFVSLRGERAVVELRDEGGQLEGVGRGIVGTEPMGLVASPDGAHVYAALSTQNEVVELNATLGLERSFPIEGHPSWLALHPNGRMLYVAAQLGGEVWALDLGEDSPTPLRVTFPEVVGAGREADLPYARRVTGDLSVDAAGERLAVPVLFVDNKTPPKHSIEEAEQGDPSVYYDSIGLGLSPNNPVVALAGLDADGLPDGSLDLLYAVGEAPWGDEGETRIVRSFLSSVTFSPDGERVVACMEGSEAVAELSTDPDEFSSAYGVFLASPTSFAAAGEGPRSVAWVGEDRPFVYTFLDRTVGELGAVAAPPMVVASSGLPPEVDLGRSLYYSAVNPVMSTAASGISCSTCHFEGRNDGLTWPLLGDEFRQTLSLAGPVSSSPPFTWSNNIETVEEEVRLTSQVRLGGRDITDAQLAAVAAFVEYTRDVDHPERGSRSAAVLRGEALFAREDVGCRECHAGDRFSDNDTHDLYGVDGLNTPVLVGIAATPPYLHDGSAATLRDVLDTTRVGAMGDTAMLDDAELEDLEAYLRSL